MVDNRSAPELIHEYTARWQAYGAFLNPTITGSMPTLITTADPLAVIPTGYPYPSGGTNLGIINGKVKVNKGAELEDIPAAGLGTVSQERFYKGYKRTVEFQLLSSGRKEVVDIFDDPGFSSDGDSSGGGLSDAPEYVLINMFKDAHHEDVYLCYIHWSVTPLPANEELSGDEPSIINAVFRCYAGADPNDTEGCPRSPGTQIWRRLYINSSGNIVDPENPETPVTFDPITDPYPALIAMNML